jgi:hypothetical protein
MIFFMSVPVSPRLESRKVRVGRSLAFAGHSTLLIGIQFQITRFGDEGVNHSKNSDRNVTPAGRCDCRIETSGA